MRLFFYIKELRVNLLNKNSKMAIFQPKMGQKWAKNGPKMAPNGKNSHFFYIDAKWLCLTSIQLIGMRLFLYIKELQVDLLNRNSKNGHFKAKNGP